jgi:hypothetical protein
MPCNAARSALAPEILHGAFVFLGGGARGEGSEVVALAGFGIFLARVEPVFAGFELADHRKENSHARARFPRDGTCVTGTGVEPARFDPPRLSTGSGRGQE